MAATRGDESLQWLVIPRKFTAKIDFVGCITNYVKKTYGSKTSSKIDDAAKELQQMRNDAALALNEITDKSIEYLTTYLSQLDLVEKRFPASTVKLGLNFTWSDAFNNTLTTSSDNIRFEKACIIYTIASLYSHLACRSDTGSETGLKEGVKHMQTAIGYLDLLLSSIGGLEITSSALDISVGTVTMFRSIMYAQAQAFVFNKIVISNQSHSIAAKVAAQASRYFEEAVRKGAEMKTYVPAIIVHHLEFQRVRYAACAQYFQAQSLSKNLEEKGEGCGEMIARLALCEELILQTTEVEKNAKKASGGKQVLASSLGQLAGTLLGLTKETLAAKKKENIVVYSDVIPLAADLAAIQPANTIIKAVAAPEMAEGRRDIFELLTTVTPEPDKSNCILL